MAIGLGQMFGIRFLENFNRPIRAFADRVLAALAHLAVELVSGLSLYSLGGNRGGTLATYRNLIIVFFLTGLWHGAAWTYVCWGLYQGVFLIAERIALRGRLDHVSLLPVASISFRSR